MDDELDDRHFQIMALEWTDDYGMEARLSEALALATKRAVTKEQNGFWRLPTTMELQQRLDSRPDDFKEALYWVAADFYPGAYDVRERRTIKVDAKTKCRFCLVRFANQLSYSPMTSHRRTTEASIEVS